MYFNGEAKREEEIKKPEYRFDIFNKRAYLAFAHVVALRT